MQPATRSILIRLPNAGRRAQLTYRKDFAELLKGVAAAYGDIQRLVLNNALQEAYCMFSRHEDAQVALKQLPLKPSPVIHNMQLSTELLAPAEEEALLDEGAMEELFRMRREKQPADSGDLSAGKGTVPSLAVSDWLPSIPGLLLIRDFISEAEEAELMAAIDSTAWTQQLTRRVQHYGAGFDYTTRTVAGRAGAERGSTSDSTSSSNSGDADTATGSIRPVADPLAPPTLPLVGPIAEAAALVSRYGFVGDTGDHRVNRMALNKPVQGREGCVAIAAAACAPSGGSLAGSAAGSCGGAAGVETAGVIPAAPPSLSSSPPSSLSAGQTTSPSPSASASAETGDSAAHACSPPHPSPQGDTTSTTTTTTSASTNEHSCSSSCYSSSCYPPVDQITVNEYHPGRGIASHIDTHSAFQDGICSLSMGGTIVMEFTRTAAERGAEKEAKGGERATEERGAAMAGSCDMVVASTGDSMPVHMAGGAPPAAGAGAGATVGVAPLAALRTGTAAISPPTAGGALSAASASAAPPRPLLVVLPRRSLLIMRGEARHAWAHGIAARKTDCIDGTVLPRERRVSATFRVTRRHPCVCAWPSVCFDQEGGKSEPDQLRSPALRAQREQARQAQALLSASGSVAAPAAVGGGGAADGGGEGSGEITVSRAPAKDASTAILVPNTAAGAGSSSAVKAAAAASDAAAPSPFDTSSASASSSAAAALESRHVHSLYDSIAPHFSATRHTRWPRIEAFLWSVPAGAIVADIGCGNGKYLGANPALFSAGCDRSEPLVSIAAERGHEGFVADALCPPLRPGCADIALSIAVLHHLSSVERRFSALAALLRCLRVGGIGLVYAWAQEQGSDSRRAFPGQDVLVPWCMQRHFVTGTEEEIVAQGGVMDKERGVVILQRYCHVYRGGELQSLLGAAAAGLGGEMVQDGVGSGVTGAASATFSTASPSTATSAAGHLSLSLPPLILSALDLKTQKLCSNDPIAARVCAWGAAYSPADATAAPPSNPSSASPATGTAAGGGGGGLTAVGSEAAAAMAGASSAAFTVSLPVGSASSGSGNPACSNGGAGPSPAAATHPAPVAEPLAAAAAATAGDRDADGAASAAPAFRVRVLESWWEKDNWCLLFQKTAA